jgi:SAM-dependent methyltransferase
MFLKKTVKKLLSCVGYEIRKKSLVPPPHIHRSLLHSSSAFKYASELKYWAGRYDAEGHIFQNGWYKKLMLGMARESTDLFLKDKVAVDFGCGPRGSLVWTTAPRLRIGVDVLVDKYFDCFGDEMTGHGYLYVQSTEHHIPIPTGFVDVVYTMNSMDHTDNFEIMAKELLRILKTGGEFIGSFNMNEPASASEPQTLTFEMLRTVLFPYLTIKHHITAYKGTCLDPPRATYDCFFDSAIKQPADTDVCILWMRGTKK